MGQKEKLIQRLKSKPKDFTFNDAETLLKYLDYIRSNKGKTSGSRVMFVNDEHGIILLHKPHPQKELKDYQVKQLLEILEQEGLIGITLSNTKAMSEALNFLKKMASFMARLWEFAP